MKSLDELCHAVIESAAEWDAQSKTELPVTAPVVYYRPTPEAVRHAKELLQRAGYRVYLANRIRVFDENVVVHRDLTTDNEIALIDNVKNTMATNIGQRIVADGAAVLSRRHFHLDYLESMRLRAAVVMPKHQEYVQQEYSDD